MSKFPNTEKTTFSMTSVSNL